MMDTTIVCVYAVFRLFYKLRERFLSGSTTTATRVGGSQQSRLSRSPPDEVNYREEMLRVRAQQQELANERAKIAAANRKEKEALEKERKNKVAKRDDSNKGDGNTLGRGETPAGYNPMQPWSATSRGYRYVLD